MPYCLGGIAIVGAGAGAVGTDAGELTTGDCAGVVAGTMVTATVGAGVGRRGVGCGLVGCRTTGAVGAGGCTATVAVLPSWRVRSDTAATITPRLTTAAPMIRTS